MALYLRQTRIAHVQELSLRKALVTLASRYSAPFPRSLLAVALGISGAAAGLKLRRPDSVRNNTLRLLNRISEDVIAAQTAPDILSRLDAALPKIFKKCSACLYVQNRGTKALDVLMSGRKASPPSFDPLSPPPGLHQAAAACFRNRTPSRIASRRRRIWFSRTATMNGSPRLVLLVPMVWQQEIKGVLALSFEKRRRLKPAEELAIQHLANQIAFALRFQEQSAMREHLIETGKQAIRNQLIAEIADQLRAPVTAILEAVRRLKAGHQKDREIETLEYQARQLAGTITTLLALSEPDQPEPQPLTTTQEHASSRPAVTALLVEPDEKARKEVLAIFGRNGDRLAHVGSGEEAVELVHRFRFDLVLCSARLPGLSWSDLFECIRTRSNAFVLLTAASTGDSNHLFPNREGVVLNLPQDQARLAQICERVALRSGDPYSAGSDFSAS